MLQKRGKEKMKTRMIGRFICEDIAFEIEDTYLIHRRKETGDTPYWELDCPSEYSSNYRFYVNNILNSAWSGEKFDRMAMDFIVQTIKTLSMED